MKKIFTLCVVLCMSYLSMGATNLKHEFRATWLTTAWGNDWPKKTQVTSDATRKQQQDSLIAIFDRLQAGNMNAVCFQVRARSDAFYQSSYEPWAAELAGARGKDPGYDPLAFAIEEAHKRGLELHAWVNPFRVTSSGTLSTSDKVWLNAGQWIIQYNNGSFSGQIIDPGYPEAREYVLNVLMEIVNNYDIDGIVMDDYFYPYGGTTNQDAESVAKYKPDGMNVGDWRRQNVNMMIKDVYDTIQSVKPWVTFGVSPFGIWTTDSSVASKRGITLPYNITGGNMYAEIYCDPVAWLEEGTVDYISPQLYWKIGGGQDYKKLSKWWGDICNRFGKHFYSSMALYKYEDGTFTATEIRNQLVYNRTVKDGAPGAVFYNTRAWSNSAKLRVNLTKETAEFHNLSLPPAINWKVAEERAMVENLKLDGQTLSWTHTDGKDVHFAIYAVPNDSLGLANVYSRADMLVGVAYTTSFELPSEVSNTTHQIAVSVLDRYNNEYALRILDKALGETKSATGLVPTHEAIKKLPFTFRWNAVEGADSYIIQFAKDEAMTKIVFAQEVTEPSFETKLRINLDYLPMGDYYWRVKTRIPNAGDTWSNVQKVTISLEDAVENVHVGDQPTKWIEDGQVYIQRQGTTYDMLGNIIQ